VFGSLSKAPLRSRLYRNLFGPQLTQESRRPTISFNNNTQKNKKKKGLSISFQDHPFLPLCSNPLSATSTDTGLPPNKPPKGWGASFFEQSHLSVLRSARCILNLQSCQPLPLCSKSFAGKIEGRSPGSVRRNSPVSQNDLRLMS